MSELIKLHQALSEAGVQGSHASTVTTAVAAGMSLTDILGLVVKYGTVSLDVLSFILGKLSQPPPPPPAPAVEEKPA